jgi:hypothetical protein
MNAFGVSSAHADGSYNPEGETRIQTGLASLLMAGLACVVFYTARLLLPLSWSAIIALGTAFGTQVWSTASRALWSDTWAIFLLAVSLYLLLADAMGKRKLNPILLASLLAWTYFVRPTNAISVVAIAFYVFLQRRDRFVPFFLAGLGWLAGFLFYSWYHFQQLLPNYFRPGRLNFSSFWTAFAGNLISPSRGLLVYLPVVLFIIYLAVRYRRTVCANRVSYLALPVIVVHLIVVAGFTPWNGGFCYGPRYTTGLVPWFALIGIQGVQGLIEHGRKTKPLWAGAVLLGISVFLNARGATSYETWMWNIWPDNVDQVPAKIWDWKRPQFLAGLVAPPLPEPLPVLTDRLEFGSDVADRFIWYGWSWGEKTGRWSDGQEAALAFAVPERRNSILLIRLGAFVVKDKLNEQHVTVFFNNSRIQDLIISEEPAREYKFSIERQLLRAQNTLVFSLHDAASPRSLGLSSDQRRLAIRIESIELAPQKLGNTHP